MYRCMHTVCEQNVCIYTVLEQNSNFLWLHNNKNEPNQRIYSIKERKIRMGEDNMSQIKRVKLTPAKFAVDLGDGSERRNYVN